MVKKTSGAAAAATDEFRNIPLGQIIVEGQVRSAIDQEGESFKGLMASIAEKGVIEPVLVTPRGEQFLLLAGERRFWACQKLGLETIPARILPDIQSKEEILSIQLIENLQREDIDPIDKASGILSFFQARHPDMDLEMVVNAMLNYDRDPARVEMGFTATVAVILEYTGAKTRTIENLLSLLNLAEDIRDNIRTGAIPVSQGYILAANLENPGLRGVIEAILKTPVTNQELLARLKKVAQGADGPAQEAPAPFKSVYASLQTTANRLTDGKTLYAASDLDGLIGQLKSLLALAEKAKAGGGTAAEPAPAETPPAKSPAKAATAKKTATATKKKPVLA